MSPEALAGFVPHLEAWASAMFAPDASAPYAVLPLLAAWAFGMLLGLRHAFEPDHIAAVATLVTSTRKRGSAAVLGAFWGLGHTAALVVVGGALLVFRTSVPDWMAGSLELAVSVMLIGLGVTRLRGGLAKEAPHHADGHTHDVHEGPRAWLSAGARPLLVGLVHGLAGSGALAVLVMAAMPSLGAGLLYMTLFGLGSAVGMALLTGIVGGSMRRRARSAASQAWLSAGAGVFSLAFGCFWAWQSASSILAG